MLRCINIFVLEQLNPQMLNSLHFHVLCSDCDVACFTNQTANDLGECALLSCLVMYVWVCKERQVV